MKQTLLAVILVALPGFAHAPSNSGSAVTGFSVLWNGIELWNHLNGIFGKDICCHHGTRAFHVIELVGHSANLAEGSWEWIQEKTPPLGLTIGSLAFNTWGAWAQLDTLKGREHRTYISYLLSVASAIDVWGHAASAFVAGAELKNYLTEQVLETSHSHDHDFTQYTLDASHSENILHKP